MTTRYRASYVDLVLAAEAAGAGGADDGACTVALVAGAHSRGFPYAATAPWDNCLLWVGDAGFAFTGRTPGAALDFALDLDAAASPGAIRFAGAMRRVSDGAMVDVELDIAVELAQLATRRLGESYNVLGLDGVPGMLYTPYALSGELGRLRVAGVERTLGGIRGTCERGALTNLDAHDFALRYDYVGVACAGDAGYGLIQFTSHTLFGGGALRRVLDCYLRHAASAVMTIERGALRDGNPHGVYSPPPEDTAVVLFEEPVDLGLAVLRRQMIATRDRAGRVLHGLREIFVPRP